jgi:hypothetical protein
MTDAMGGGDRGAMQQRIVQRNLEDEAFRRQLLADPKTAVEQELGTQLPPGIEVRAVEETPDTVYLVLPPSQAEGQSGGLSDSELESVAGGQPAEMTTETTCAAQCSTLDC